MSTRDDKYGFAPRGTQWPPPRPFWVTRDSDLSGRPEDVVDVWLEPPVRLLVNGYDRSAFWVSAPPPGAGTDVEPGWDLDTRWGRYVAADFARWWPLPDDDWMVIVVR